MKTYGAFIAELYEADNFKSLKSRPAFSQMTPNDEDREEIEFDVKGWMSPTGKSHEFWHGDDHRNNQHPDIAREKRNKLVKLDTRSSIAGAQKLGYARFGRQGAVNFIHYDHRSKGGTEAALHALHRLDPKAHHEILINHQPWHKGPTPEKVSKFQSRSEAAHHIRSFQK